MIESDRETLREREYAASAARAQRRHRSHLARVERDRAIVFALEAGGFLALAVWGALSIPSLVSRVAGSLGALAFALGFALAAREAWRVSQRLSEGA